MSNLDDYIQGKIAKIPNRSAFDTLFNQYIINVPARAHEFSSFLEARKGYIILKKTAAELKKLHSYRKLKKIFIECLNKDDPKKVYSALKINNSEEHETLEIIVHIFFYSLKSYDSSYPPEIRSDYISNAISYATELSLLDEISHGRKFKPGRKKGSISSTTQAIHDLLIKHPNLSAKDLQNKAAKKDICNMHTGTFSNIVSNARQILGLPKPKKHPHK